jgi:hypothetical protein
MKITMQTDNKSLVSVVLENEGIRYSFSGVVTDVELQQAMDLEQDLLSRINRLKSPECIFNLQMASIKHVTREVIPSETR